MVYEPFFFQTSGDHRGFYIDFELSSLFSRTVPTFGTSSRGFSSKDCKAVTIYLTEFKAHIDAHNVFHRFNELQRTGLPNHNFIETINQKITRACKHAESKCRRRQSGHWTQELHQLKLHHSVLCQFKSRLCRQLPLAHVLQ